MSRGKDQPLDPHKDGWAVKGAENYKATSIQPTQQKAIKDAIGTAKHQNATSEPIFSLSG